jgi:23S rRNA (pseudouridine1915-N3)-methyltransferase
MPPECRLNLIEIPAVKRTKAVDIKRLLAQEGERMLQALPKNALVVAMDVTGRRWNTEDLAHQLDAWMHEGRDIALLVGGPDGLPPACREQADRSWSLSPLTFPHPLVRIIVAEQLYRATTILKHHPYHK